MVTDVFTRAANGQGRVRNWAFVVTVEIAILSATRDWYIVRLVQRSYNAFEYGDAHLRANLCSDTRGANSVSADIRVVA